MPENLSKAKLLVELHPADGTEIVPEETVVEVIEYIGATARVRLPDGREYAIMVTEMDLLPRPKPDFFF